MKSGAWKRWANKLKKNIYTLYLVSRDPKVPALPKIIIGMVVAYALSPVDLIPDFIPVIGYIDDLCLLPAGIWLAIRLVPPDVWRECQMLAQQQVFKLPRNRRVAAMIVINWFVAIVSFILWMQSFLSGIKSA